MFGLVAVHDYAALGLEFPRALVDIKHDYVHAEIHRSLLSAETGAERRVEEYHHQRLVAAEICICKTVGFDLEGLLDCEIMRAYIFDCRKIFHRGLIAVSNRRLAIV